MTAKVSIEQGDRFGRLLVVDPDGPRKYPNKSNPRGYRSCVVRCDCGSPPFVVLLNSLRTGNSRSCGCLRSETTSGFNLTKRTHGLRKHPLYATWVGIRQRCNNPRNPNWPSYGGRGIRVCPEWEDLVVFVADIEREIGPRPDGRSLDRVDNDGDYCPGNVRWATPPEQAANQRKVRDLTRRVAELEEEVARLAAQLADYQGGSAVQ